MPFSPQEKYMRQAVLAAQQGMARRQTPFGACIVKSGKVIACEHNRVWKDTDITAHAEITAIRAACRKLKTIDLSGAVIYSTCEPCPMCFSAIHWAKIRAIVFGASIKDAAAAGFNELAISNQKLKQAGKLTTIIVPGFLRKECRELFETWQRNSGSKTY